MKVAIIGGGLTGLSSAYYMGKAFPDWEIHVLESSNRWGGKVQTKRHDGYVVEVGPDSYLARKTAMTDLVKELGLGDTLVRNATGESYIYHQGQMKPIPGGSIIGIPTEFLPFAMSSLLSWSGKLRAGLDIFKKPYPGHEDMSIDAFFRYHLGDELVDVLIEPLLAGIYGGDLKRLSLLGTFPEFRQLEQKHGNLVKGMMAMQGMRKQSGAATEGQFAQLTGGLESLVDALVEQMPKNVSLHTSTEVLEASYADKIYRVQTQNGTDSYDRLVITTPPKAYERFFVGDEQFEDLRHMEQSSCAIVIMSLPKSAFTKPLQGTGFVITRSTETPLTACTYISSKWPQTTPQDKVVLRVFLGKPTDSTVDTHSEEELCELALSEIRNILKFTGNPEWMEVVRLQKSMPQYEVGHKDRIATIMDRVAQNYPGLALIGTPFKGVGMPDGIKQAYELVEAWKEETKEVVPMDTHTESNHGHHGAGLVEKRPEPSYGHPGAGSVEGRPDPTGLEKVPETYEGWFSLHANYSINFEKWRSWSGEQQSEALQSFKAFIGNLEAAHEGHTSSYAMYQINGHKGDIMFWFLQPSLQELNEVELQLKKLPIFSVLQPESSFVSVIEVSNYVKSPKDHPKVQARLYPKIPRLACICFYPMAKQRNLTDNWYMLDRQSRGSMMRSHGQIGKKYEDTIKEFTTGAFGMDDWEWGITLMSDDPIQFKKIVNEMRFDEVSARFGIFGPFTIGTILDIDGIEHLFS